jgi:hypothetical protein
VNAETEETKICTKCKTDKSLNEFHKTSSNKSGFQSSCKACRKEYYESTKEHHSKVRKIYYRENREKILIESGKSKKKHRRRVKNQHLQRYYGITLEQYESLYEKQEGKCAICDIHRSEQKRDLSVDHCHKTSEVRGLLCDTCNRGLGYFKDDIILFEKAIKYLRKEND